MKEYCKTLRVQASKDLQTRGRVESLTYLVTTVINLILKRNLSQVEKKFFFKKQQQKVVIEKIIQIFQEGKQIYIHTLLFLRKPT